MKLPQLQILHQIDPPTSRPFRLLEIYQSADGPRTRVCSGAWESYADARAAADKLLAESRTKPLGLMTPAELSAALGNQS